MIKSATLHKFTRILYLLNKLDKGTITLTQEAKELGFSARTLQRDLHEIERAGFPLTEISARYKWETDSLSRTDQYTEKRLKNQIKECQREIQEWQRNNK